MLMLNAFNEKIKHHYHAKYDFVAWENKAKMSMILNE